MRLKIRVLAKGPITACILMAVMAQEGG